MVQKQARDVVSQTLMQNHTLATLPQRQVQRRTRQRPTKSPSSMNIFYPVAVQKGAISGITELLSLFRKSADGLINYWRTYSESTVLFQQLSIALQRGTAVAFLNTFDSDYRRCCSPTLFGIMFTACGSVYWWAKEIKK